ncbi:MAG: hypothetical protein H6597_06040 [Flavobacteriales bacterium]|nr:hypothetical protein [Flavobacteriales bacterium]MCB9194076.1 hypothetical protein [Flavobacteriales bacterium]
MDHIDLLFNGLDTYADIFLNGAYLGHADNMFRSWRFEVRPYLKSGPDTLEVRFRSPLKIGRDRERAFGIQLPSDNETGQVKVAPYVRKAAFQFGWDLCPPLVTCGIWKPVALEAWDQARVAEVRVEQTDRGDVFQVVCRITIAGAREGILVAASLDGDMERSVPDRTGVAELTFAVKDPQRWWPNGSGDQVLYPLDIEVWKAGAVLDRRVKRIGLRSIQLDQEADSIGNAFTFMVNGHPLFMQGANLLPPDMLLPRAGDQAWVRLVKDMQRAHFNMVRVWAGGVYPPDAFLDACDTAGILVWQDLMFADLVPDDPAFTANVEAEVREQVRRIRDHACLALWCGNNELDVAWKNWGWQRTYGYSPRDSIRLRASYLALFEHEIPQWIGELDGTSYIPSSPLSNWGNAAGLRNGDLHYWGVWHADSTFRSYGSNVGRFVSEYGFQSYPDSATLAEYLSPQDLFPGSPVLEHRQRSYRTDRPIRDAIERELGPVPRTLQGFIEASQKVQAMALHMAIMSHRAAAPRCMGTLFWQLNDCWPGPSWSVIDVNGRWKAAMYQVERDLRPSDRSGHPALVPK